MSIFSKLNKGVDVILKIVILIIAFSVALLPVAFIFGHETLHQQDWSQSFSQLEQIKPLIEQAKTKSISNIFLQKVNSKGMSPAQITLQLADYVCYTLHNEGNAVVRKNIEGKTKKKGKKNQHTAVKGYKFVQTLHENPPLRQLKQKISKCIDFESEALSNKYWVIALTGDLDANFANQIETIIDKNPEYKFILVTSKKLKHKNFGKESNEAQVSQQDAQIEQEASANNIETSEATVQASENKTEDKKKKKEKKDKSKVKVKKIKQVQQEIPVQTLKQQL